ncbi:MAG: lipoyl synthase [Actinomycetota bacterium]
MTGTLNWPDSATGSATAPPSAGPDNDRPLHVRWLGPVAYAEAWDLQRQLFVGEQHHLLLCEHPPVYTLGPRAEAANVLVEPETIGASMHHVDRGGDVTFHGPGQLVGYPIVTLPGRRGGGLAETAAYVATLERLLIDVAARLGIDAGRLPGFPGVWVDPHGARPRKLAAVGVRLARGRTMHGFALNVDVDLGWFDHIVPCGIADKAVTSLRAEGVEASMEDVVRLVTELAPPLLTPDRPVVDQAVAFRQRHQDLAPFSRGAGPGEPVSGGPTAEAEATAPAGPMTGVPVRLRGRLAEAGVAESGHALTERKPPWMRVKLRTEPRYRELKRLARDLELTTVCEEAGCPNIFDCWNEGTATFMLLGERCTRACGFCLVDTSKPEPPDEGEPARIADAVRRLGLQHVVLTMVARDDLDDGGADIVARSVEAIRSDSPQVAVEVLVSDLKGDRAAFDRVRSAEPDVFNHNIETVARLQRAVRPSASYGRSLALLARAATAGLTTKSGIIVGMGETPDEVRATMADLAAVGVSIVTIGQYLRPTSHHLPVHRWWTPDEFEELARFGQDDLGIPIVQASPLTRSSHHAGTVAASLPTPVSLRPTPNR